MIYPYKRKIEGNLLHTEEKTGREERRCENWGSLEGRGLEPGELRMPTATGNWGPGGFAPRTSRGTAACWQLDCRLLASRTPWEYISVVLACPVGGNLLWQSSETIGTHHFIVLCRYCIKKKKKQIESLWQPSVVKWWLTFFSNKVKKNEGVYIFKDNAIAHLIDYRVSQVVLVVKNLPACQAGDLRDAGSIPGLGRSPGVENGNPLQYSCLGNSMDRAAWWGRVHRVPRSQTQLKWLSMHTV